MKKNIFFINIPEKILILLLILFSLLINQHYGYLGILPIDSFLIFDSANYILNGLHPFKDYWTITGPLLDYFQAVFFFIFGINWFSYVLHASVMNLILTIFSYFLFTKLGLEKKYAFIYSLGIALLAYPGIGTPFIDQHSTIFSILATYCFILGIKQRSNIFWFLIPLFLVCAFFSKQIPASYIIVFLSLALLFYFINYFDIKKFYFLFFGILFTSAFFSFFFIIYGIPFDNFIIQYIFYPLSLGQYRFENLNFGFGLVIKQFKFIYLCLIPLITILFKIILQNKKSEKAKMDFLIIFLIVGINFIFIYTQLLTSNQVLIFFLIPIITAFSHIYFLSYFKKKYFLYFVICICIFSVTKYHLRFNEQKKFMELEHVNLNLAIDAGEIHKIFKGLKWITHHYPTNPEQEVKNLIEIKEYLNSDTKNKIIISDYQFFTAISDTKFTSPNKWYDDKSIPRNNNKYFATYKDFFIDKLKQNEVAKVYLIGDYKSSYFEDVIQNENCIKSDRINEMLIIYDIVDCEL